jgi:hypothetical protein
MEARTLTDPHDGRHCAWPRLKPRAKGKVHLALEIQMAVDVLGALPATAIVKPACQPSYWFNDSEWNCTSDPSRVDCWHCQRAIAARARGGGHP